VTAPRMQTVGSDMEAATSAVRSELLDAANALGPLVRAEGEAAERSRRITKRARDALAGAGFFRLLTPVSLGGLEVDPLTAALVIETVTTYDSTAGWTLMTGNSVDWFCSRLPEGGAEELYADDGDALIAAAFHPPMRAVEGNGGYRVSGRAPLASTIHDATWFHCTALVMDGDEPRMVDGAPVVVGVIVRAGEVEVIDTWDALGMRGSDSNDVVLADVFVPSRRTFAMSPHFVPGRHYPGPLYRISVMAFVASVGPPVLLGIAADALAEFQGLAAAKTPFGATTALRERAVVQARFAQAEGLVRSGRALLHAEIAEAWRRALRSESPSLEQKADALLAATHAAAGAAQAVEIVHRLAGTTGIYRRSRLERHLRDALTLRQHGFMSENRYETAGQVHLGVGPEFAIVGL
jgi:alkylation response protein AidB-like acyl-CoA dehydrogenase